MNILQCNKLTSEQKQHIEELYAHCCLQEPLTQELFLVSDMNVEPEKPCFFLAYEAAQLVSFLTAFFPTKEEVEFTGFTHPDKREQGHMTALIAAALPLFSQARYHQALFIREKGSQSGEEFLSKRYPAIARTEYVLELKSNAWKTRQTTGVLTEVTPQTQEIAGKILSEIFEQDEQTSKQHLTFLLSRPDGQVYLYYVEGVPVGTVNVHYLDKEVAMIHAVGIHKPLRRKGHGERMMVDLLNMLTQNTSAVRLEVDSDNPPALALYQKLGFCTLNRVDYHAMIF
ncbi:GNAT family N-acetyltransferase [uncultured Sphaerochaeta sp.]|uniref:GNAT family N-acetyltransferase n=1 Tax=uncultured Sphaerochaeta sp. TaxID=886478 RepID=UPI0029C9E82A|nr:GNAT family N-acetyltransferase [uncultured Sphaerochaeta sp.]